MSQALWGRRLQLFGEHDGAQTALRTAWDILQGEREKEQRAVGQPPWEPGVGKELALVRVHEVRRKPLLLQLKGSQMEGSGTALIL